MNAPLKNMSIKKIQPATFWQWKDKMTVWNHMGWTFAFSNVQLCKNYISKINFWHIFREKVNKLKPCKAMCVVLVQHFCVSFTTNKCHWKTCWRVQKNVIFLWKLKLLFAKTWGTTLSQSSDTFLLVKNRSFQSLIDSRSNYSSAI